MTDHKNLLVAILASLAACVFLLDRAVLPGITVWVLYPVVVAASLGLPSQRQTYLVGAFCTVLALVGRPLPVRNDPSWIGWANRLLGVLVLWMVAALIHFCRRARDRTGLKVQVRDFLDSMMDAVISIDSEQRIILFNRAAEEVFGCPAAEVIGQSLDRLIPERYRTVHRQHVRHFGEKGASRRRMGALGMVSGLRASGEEFPIEASISKVDVAGKRIYSVILRDVSERQRAEERLRWQANLIDRASDAIMVRDLEDRIVFWNKSAERIYGWPAGEVLGRTPSELLFGGLLPEHVVEASRTLSVTEEWAGEFQHVTRDGKEITVASRWVTLRDDHGSSQGKLVLNTDITARKQLEGQLLRSQRLESIGTLAGGIAHDFNNLLNPILMSARLLQIDRPEEDRQHLLKILQASAERGAEIVKHLLAFTGRTDRHLETVSLASIIREIKEILNHTLPKSVQVQVCLAEDLWPVHADATQLSQVVMNLCVNARDAMPQGGTITIAAENRLLDEIYAGKHADARPGPYVLLSVADTGVGLPATQIDKIFDPFFTTKEQGKGTGLGLSTALGIVKGHGGFISVASTPGEETCFVIHLPALADGIFDRTVAQTRETPNGLGELVLVVDDELNVRETTKMALVEHGYRVLAAQDGEEALALYQEHRAEIRVVILDMVMPVLDGPATMAALRQIDAQVRIIATSGLRGAGLLPAAEEAVFLPKPYSDVQLLTALAKILRAG